MRALPMLSGREVHAWAVGEGGRKVHVQAVREGGACMKLWPAGTPATWSRCSHTYERCN